jgi:dephospho-CoA kinase
MSNNETYTCLRVGITGGIGSGKSTVCKIFETLGVPIYDADYWAKWLIVNDLEIKNGIQSLLGEEAYLPDGTYNRPYVGKIVFAEPEKLAALNALVHPAVELHSKMWHLDWVEKGKPYTLKEAALLVESGAIHFLDKLIVVTAPESMRIERVMQRDGSTQEQVLARMKNQLPEAKKVALADFVIDNGGEELLVNQVWKVHRMLIEISMK